LLTWQADSRSLRIGPGAESYLEIHENFNTGWSATLNGRPLTPVRLDGWQQAFIVPAGQDGVIRLSYGSATVYHAGLIASALALLVLVLLAAGPGLRRRLRRTAAGAGPAAGPPPGGSSHGPPHGPRRGGHEPRARERGRRAARTAAAFVPLAVVIGLAGGPAVIAVPVLACLGWRWPRWLPRVALGAMLVAGIAAASSGSPTDPGSGAFGGLAQVCALVALTAALMPEVAREAVSTGTGPAAGAERAS
jgi:arabinofuranan 3-O-arabinosyltransferase